MKGGIQSIHPEMQIYFFNSKKFFVCSEEACALYVCMYVLLRETVLYLVGSMHHLTWHYSKSQKYFLMERIVFIKNVPFDIRCFKNMFLSFFDSTRYGNNMYMYTKHNLVYFLLCLPPKV